MTQAYPIRRELRIGRAFRRVFLFDDWVDGQINIEMLNNSCLFHH